MCYDKIKIKRSFWYVNGYLINGYLINCYPITCLYTRPIGILICVDLSYLINVLSYQCIILSMVYCIIINIIISFYVMCYFLSIVQAGKVGLGV